MSSKIFNRKVFTAVFVPLFVTGFQLFVRAYNGVENQTLFHSIGVSLAAIALSQMFPFIMHDHLMLTKVYVVEAVTKANNNSVHTKYGIRLSRSEDEIDRLRTNTVYLFCVVLTLFILCVLLAFQDDTDWLHTILGTLAVAFSGWYVLSS